MRDQVRAGLFAIIQDFLPGSRFLDLFAGTGSVGIEALSRGAKSCIFVDNLPEAVQLIKQNLAALGLTSQAKVYQLDVFAALERLYRRGRRFELIFIGPPYGQGLVGPTLARIAELGLLEPGGLAIAEIFKKERSELQERYGPLRLIRERRYGDNLIVIYQASQPRKEEEREEERR